MTARIRVEIEDDEDGAETRSLARWLTRDSSITPRAGVALDQADGVDDMGGVIEVISLVVSSAIGLGSLVVSVASWRDSRPKPGRVRFRLPDGSLVEVVEDGEAVIHDLAAAVGVLGGGDAPDRP
ncbi:effector-associated constant component EACC1 [Micromonospora sp. CA-263727]|uniref:effector-associated constant component EACC1 n=1 Tax=Micromonospora sp. CA-263727 TaxID=3239967 RepID=UPI003D8EA0E0